HPGLRTVPGGEPMTRTVSKIFISAATLIVALPAAQALASPKSKLHFSASAYAVPENTGALATSPSNPHPGFADITIARSSKPAATLSQTVTVAFSSSSTSPNASGEFTPVNQTLTFAPNQKSAVVSIPINDDGLPGGPVIVNLRLS